MTQKQVPITLFHLLCPLMPCLLSHPHIHMPYPTICHTPGLRVFTYPNDPVLSLLSSFLPCSLFSGFLSCVLILIRFAPCPLLFVAFSLSSFPDVHCSSVLSHTVLLVSHVDGTRKGDLIILKEMIGCEDMWEEDMI